MPPSQTAEQSLSTQHVSRLDKEALRVAYRRWSSFYDVGFGIVSGMARRSAVSHVNQGGGKNVLEVGVGTGLALPLYDKDKSVTGIDLTGEMLAKARERVARSDMPWVRSLDEMDAEAMGFEDASFDTAVAMFVSSVVPRPRKLLSEMRRVVKPGGKIVFVNHFARDGGVIGLVERLMAPGAKTLGWNPDFRLDGLLSEADQQRAQIRHIRPLGIFTLVSLTN